MRRARESEFTWLLALAGATVLLGVLIVNFPLAVPLAAFGIPTLLGGLLLSVRSLLWLYAVIALVMAACAGLIGGTVVSIGAVIVVAVTAIIVFWNARQRSALGVAARRGETMLIDLRDRLKSQGMLPELPWSWYVEAVLASAGGASFAGDFIVSAKTHDDRMLEVAVVDVSGKGLDAGTRALMLSGAFGGLLGALPPTEFLPAANAYLRRQHWEEGFASAIHLALDLNQGSYELRAAGHPPAVQLHAGSGRWVLQAPEGPVLGLVDDAEFTAARGRLLPGDAMLLYTDGLVETPQRDITLGIDKLVGEAERLITRGFERGAAYLLSRIDSKDDDRALLLLHRR